MQAELLHYHFEYLHLNLHRYSSTVQVQFLKRLHFLKKCKFFPMKAEWPVQVQVQLVKVAIYVTRMTRLTRNNANSAPGFKIGYANWQSASSEFQFSLARGALGKWYASSNLTKKSTSSSIPVHKILVLALASNIQVQNKCPSKKKTRNGTEKCVDSKLRFQFNWGLLHIKASS